MSAITQNYFVNNSYSAPKNIATNEAVAAAITTMQTKGQVTFNFCSQSYDCSFTDTSRNRYNINNPDSFFGELASAAKTKKINFTCDDEPKSYEGMTVGDGSELAHRTYIIKNGNL